MEWLLKLRNGILIAEEGEQARVEAEVGTGNVIETRKGIKDTEVEVEIED